MSLLEGINVDGRSGLDVLIQTWCENAEVFQGFWPSRIRSVIGAWAGLEFGMNDPSQHPWPLSTFRLGASKPSKSARERRSHRKTRDKRR